jgi:hypothetical protein
MFKAVLANEQKNDKYYSSRSGTTLTILGGNET